MTVNYNNNYNYNSNAPLKVFTSECSERIQNSEDPVFNLE